MVGPTTEKCVWLLFPVFVSITQFFDFWVMSYGNWKHIKYVFSFQNSISNGIFIIKPTNFETSASMFDFWVILFYFILFWNKVTAGLSDDCQVGGVWEIEVF